MKPLHPTLEAVTENISSRSKRTRNDYLDRMRRAIDEGPRRAHLSCGNQAHAYSAMGEDKKQLAESRAPNIGIITAYNDMLSAHQPYAEYPDIIKSAARAVGATAQVAGGVPAMCDGVTQGQTGMELSLFSRDVIALAAGIGLSHNTYDAAVFLGVCDKIVPGLVMAAASFGHIPAIFLPAGPMTSGLANDEKTRVRKAFATGEVGRDALMAAEMSSYHGPGTCTFYGTANSNQMLMEFMGLHLPGSSFVTPGTPLREALTRDGVARVLSKTALGNDFLPVGEMLDAWAFVNGIVGLMATGGSTNLVMHLPAMARAAGILLDLDDFAEISACVPLMARIYPNGLADVNHFHAAGGLPFMIGDLLDAGLLHGTARAIGAPDIGGYRREPVLQNGVLAWRDGPSASHNEKILRPAARPFQATGGLAGFSGNLGQGVMKVSSVAPDQRLITAPARVFTDQASVKDAFRAGTLNRDVVVVVRFQGPCANGMPELHGLTPVLSVLQDRGHKVALVTDGRMSGASGKVPAVIHLCPEAAKGGPIARIADGDMISIDAARGVIEVLDPDFADRAPVSGDLAGNATGMGREMFEIFRRNAGLATHGAAVIV